MLYLKRTLYRLYLTEIIRKRLWKKKDRKRKPIEMHNRFMRMYHHTMWCFNLIQRNYNNVNRPHQCLHYDRHLMKFKCKMIIHLHEIRAIHIIGLYKMQCKCARFICFSWKMANLRLLIYSPLIIHTINFFVHVYEMIDLYDACMEENTC